MRAPARASASAAVVTIISLSKTQAQLHADLLLPGGTIDVAGVEQQSNPFTLAVTGGTGTYQGARGEVTVKLLPGRSQANPAALTVYLDSYTSRQVTDQPVLTAGSAAVRGSTAMRSGGSGPRGLTRQTGRMTALAGEPDPRRPGLLLRQGHAIHARVVGSACRNRRARAAERRCGPAGRSAAPTTTALLLRFERCTGQGGTPDSAHPPA